MWLTLFNLLVSLLLGVIRRLEAQQQLDRARTEVAYELIRKANDLVTGVDDIVSTVSHEPADVVRDPANRDKSEPRSGGTS